MFPASAASQLTTTSTPMLQHILSGGEMLRSNPQYWAMGGATLVYWIGLAYYQGQSRKVSSPDVMNRLYKTRKTYNFLLNSFDTYPQWD